MMKRKGDYVKNNDNNYLNANNGSRDNINNIHNVSSAPYCNHFSGSKFSGNKT